MQHRPAGVVSVDVVAGPDAGSWTLVAAGRHVIGRSADCAIVLDDATVSRYHLEIRVGRDGGSVAVHPIAGGSNPVTVNGWELEGPIVVTDTDVVGIGTSRLRLRWIDAGGGTCPDATGEIRFRRTPYRVPAVADRGVQTVGPIPARHEARRLQALSLVAPLFAGLALFAFMRQVEFLALTLLSPLMILATMLDDRRSGRRSFGAALVEFREMLVRRRAELSAMREAERTERLAAAPDLAQLVRRAELRTSDLWARGHDAADFLHLRIGTARAPARLRVELEPGGAPDLRAEALAVLAGVDEIDEVPVTHDLEHGLLALCGEPALVDGMAASLLVQAACLHSPADLAVAVAVARAPRFGWVSWLPHAAGRASPVSAQHLASAGGEAAVLVEALRDLAASRLAGGERGPARAWQHVMLVIDTDLAADGVALAALLEVAPAAGISVICLAARPADVPRQATAVLAMSGTEPATGTGRLWSRDPRDGDREVALELLGSHLAERAARALAPVRDASSASPATIPRSVDLLDVLDVGVPSARWVTRRWSAPATSGAHQLRFVIGVGAGGPVELDLVRHGPHMLVAGTTGAGKSELLHALVASLASSHPPQRLNFLFVDYKGGATSQPFERLPHTVGTVTNLDGELAVRVLTSLRAELDHRMRLLEGRARDLSEMLANAPGAAPASLLIIVDELATLVRDVPDFVTGLIDIAQRGRSLGVHLVLATQRPSGAVSDDVLANVNLRIALRMLDRAESTAMIGGPEAAEIPGAAPGRAVAWLGPTRLVPFQTAFGGAPLGREDDRRHRTQLDAVIEAVAVANRQLGIPSPRRPWCDELPDVLPLSTLLDDPRCEQARRLPGRLVAIGMLDLPDRQQQLPLLVDLERGGGLLIFGCGVSGKTTAVRSLAAALSAWAGTDELAMLVFDFGSRGLSDLRLLPTVIDVVGGNGLEPATRHVEMLEHELRSRRAIAAVRAEHHTPHHDHDHHQHQPTPRIVVLIDGFGALADAFGEDGGHAVGVESWPERIMRVVIDGRPLGIHAVITADRRSAVPARLQAAISNRLVLRMADELGYAEHGIPARMAQQDWPPGRGLWMGTTVVQLAALTASCSTREHSAHAQSAAVASVAPPFGGERSPVMCSAPLPDVVPIEAVPGVAGCGGGRVAIGIADVTGLPVVLDLAGGPALVVGPPGSGRSTALATIAHGLVADHDVRLLGGEQRESAADLTEVAAGRPLRPVALVIDDLDLLDAFDPALVGHWDRLARSRHVRIVAAVEPAALSSFAAHPHSAALLATLRRARRMLVLQPDDAGELLQIAGRRFVPRPGLRFPPGRGVLFVERAAQVVQIAQGPQAMSWR